MIYTYKHYLFTSLILLLLFSCNSNEKHRIVVKEKNRTSSYELIKLKNKELELKEKELNIKEQKLKYLKLELSKEKNTTQPQSLNDIYNKVKKSVYLVYAEKSEMTSQGSAFVVSQDGLTVSNYHVFEDASSSILYNEDNEEFFITEVIEYSEEDDYIIFRIGPTSKIFPYLDISTTKCEIGEDCFAIGNPKGLTQTLSNGIISSYRNNGSIIQTTAEITHGSSGGPLFNSKGQVIGITSSGLDEANLNFAVNIERLHINSLINNNSITKTKKLTSMQIEEVVNTYYTALLNENFSELSTIYTPTLKKYYNHFNYSKNEAIKSAKNYKEKYGIIYAKNNIRWNTLQHYNVNGIERVEFIMDYELLRIDKSKPSYFVLNIIIEINSNLRIQSIYENILSKKRKPNKI